MRRTRTPIKAGFRSSTALCALMLCIAVIGGSTHPACAQSTPASSNKQDLLKAEELEQLVAPIALYPDTLLSQVLTASTYPLEVVQADRWVKDNKGLKGDAKKQAVDKQSWDDTVKALTVAPDVLNMMSTKLEWMQKVGDAVLAQQADVMDAIQRLRKKAQANDKLKTTKEQKVSTNTQAGKDYIVIEPADTNTLYVPFFDPLVVYGAWSYPAYPPYAFPTPYYLPGTLLATGMAFATGVAVGAWARGGGWWGGGFNWGNNNININNNIDVNKVRNWQHNVDHRGGVRYGNDAVRQKYANRDIGGGANQRLDFRGRDGQQVLRPDGGRPGGDRPGGIDRPGGGDRPGAGNRPGGGDRPGAGNRPGGGDRTGTGNRPGGDRPAQRPAASGGRPGGGGGALANIDRGGGGARAEASRGRASLGGGGGGGGGRHVSGGGGGGRQFSGGGGGGFRGGGGGGGGRGRR